MLARLLFLVFTKFLALFVTPAGCCYGHLGMAFIEYLATLLLKFVRAASVQLQRCAQRERARVLIHGFVFPGVGVMAVIRTLASLRNEGEDFSEAHLHCFFSGLFSGISWFEVVAWYLVSWLFVFLKYMFTDALKFEKAPSSHRGAEGTWQWLRLLVVSFLASYTRHGPLVPVQRQSTELPATTVGEWRRRHSLRRHKGGLGTVF